MQSQRATSGDKQARCVLLEYQVLAGGDGRSKRNLVVVVIFVATCVNYPKAQVYGRRASIVELYPIGAAVGMVRKDLVDHNSSI